MLLYKKIINLMIIVLSLYCTTCIGDDVASRALSGKAAIVIFLSGRIDYNNLSTMQKIQIHPEDNNFRPATVKEPVYSGANYLVILIQRPSPSDPTKTIYPIVRYSYSDRSWNEIYDGAGSEGNTLYAKGNSNDIVIMLNDGTCKIYDGYGTNWRTIN